MRPLAFDTETTLIRPGLHAPPMVCVTWQRPGLDPQIRHVKVAESTIREWLLDPQTLLVGHNAAYDSAVICAQYPALIPLVFGAYRNNRVTCTKKRQQLLDIAGGVFRGRPGEKGRWVTHEYSLEALSRRFLNQEMEKDEWRLQYASLLDVPVDLWPEGARRYAITDATTTLQLFTMQEKHADYLHDQYRQSYADFVLYLSSVWGLRTSAEGVAALKAEIQESYDDLREELQTLKLVREDGSRDMKTVRGLMVQACADLKLPLRRTPAHFKNTFGEQKDQPCPDGDTCEKHVSLDSDACEAVSLAAMSEGEETEQAETIVKYSEFTTLSKMLTNDCVMLEGGITYPVHTRYDLAETGRTTSSKPNIQNLNTGRIKNAKSKAQSLRPGIRQAFVPRPGHVFIQCDYPQLELYTLAQCCYSWFGQSALGDMLNAGMDPHLAFAAKLLRITYEDAKLRYEAGDPETDGMRQIGKAFNFGKPGGMGDTKFRTAAWRMYGVKLTPEQCREYSTQWHESLPEMRMHFARVNALFEDAERASVETLWTKRIRGGASYCAACNNGFQALGVDCAKRALCLIAEAQYTKPDSPLFGSRTVAFVHDEIVGEATEERAPGAAIELGRLMAEGANTYLPNVPIAISKLKPLVMRTWSKKAKPIWEKGKLVPWSLAN